ncbi:hypothetical protein ERO13_1Z049301v2 [Gossypium hirsutum]|nr:hypothetical protein ERO13_1Z049301v2 [Gossypium hirsutum]
MGRRLPLNGHKEVGLKRGPWTAEEDQILMAYIHSMAIGNWRALPEKAGLKRCGKSCRLRWINYLRPDIKRGKLAYKKNTPLFNSMPFLETGGQQWQLTCQKEQTMRSRTIGIRISRKG